MTKYRTTVQSCGRATAAALIFYHKTGDLKSPYSKSGCPKGFRQPLLVNFTYRWSTRSLISAVRPWFQNWVPM